MRFGILSTLLSLTSALLPCAQAAPPPPPPVAPAMRRVLGGHIDMFLEIVQGFLALAPPTAIDTLLALPPPQRPSIEELAFVPRRPHMSYYLLPHPLRPPSPVPSPRRPSAAPGPPSPEGENSGGRGCGGVVHGADEKGAGAERETAWTSAVQGPSATAVTAVTAALPPAPCASVAMGEAGVPTVEPLTPGILRALGFGADQRRRPLVGGKRPGSPLRRFPSGRSSEHITDQERLTES